ncbi:MAG: phosphotransferase [Gammaproteobacteria bacterium]|nr:phosphotransferase [Gammaproteobacteria bacterium]
MSNTELIRRLPYWQSEVSIEVLGGGITNHNYLVTPTGTNDQFVVRLGEDIPVHHINRHNELAASNAAHEAGLAPAIRYFDKGVLVMDYIDAVALEASNIQQQPMLERIVPLIKRCHDNIPNHLRGTPIVFWVFHVIRDYARSLNDAQSSHSHKLPDLLLAAKELEKAAGPFEIVFGHNDLLAANILDDGSRLWLIDWEYAGFNTPLFDLGGLASNNSLTENQERWMLERYYEQVVDDELWRRYFAMKTASLLREAMWSMVSEAYSTLDFDYPSYTRENLVNYHNSYKKFKTM